MSEIVNVNSGTLKSIFKKRGDNSNKGNFGQVAVIGGSVNYVGAPTFGAQSAETLTDALTAAYHKKSALAENDVKHQAINAAELICANGEAAMLLGTGTTALAVPDFLAQPLYSYVRLSSIYPLMSKNGYIVFDKQQLDELLKRTTAFLIGCGMGEDKGGEYISYILNNGGQNVVVDADALFKLDGIKLDSRAVLTPHIGEFARLTGIDKNSTIEKQAELCAEYAEKFHCTIVLKGSVTYVSDGEIIYKNTAGNAKLAKGGSGDVLGGVIAGLLSWGVSPVLAGAAGAYILGRAAELSPVNEFSHLPTDIIKQIPAVIDEIIKA